MTALNPETNKNYRGINAIWLSMQGRKDPRWMTYRQASSMEAQVRKGEKGTLVEYWQWTEKRPAVDSDGKAIHGPDGKPLETEFRLERPKVFLATVFNAEQIDGLAPFVAPEPTFDPIERAEAIIRGAGAASLHQATKLPVIVALDAGNLEPVAKAVRQKHPEAELIIAADSDARLKENPKIGKDVGVEAAKAAAEAVSGRVIVPQLKSVEIAAGLTDFNDVAQAHGIRALAEMVKKEISPAAAKGTGFKRQISAGSERGMAM